MDTQNARTDVLRHFDNLDRRARVAEARLTVAADAGSALAKVAYEYAQDPNGVGTGALALAYQRFMQLHAGNFGGPTVTAAFDGPEIPPPSAGW